MISTSSFEESSVSVAVPAMFCSHLERGLHAAAQPLTILLASLGKGYTDPMSTAELRELTASSAVQVQRVCSLFSCLQQLVIAESIPPQLSSTPIQPLLTHVADGVNLMFEKDGMSFNPVVPDKCRPGLINRPRTHQALMSVLLIAHLLSKTRDTIEFVAASSAEAIQIIVRNANSFVDQLDTETSLSMALAEANIRSQRGNLSWSLQPFNVQIELQEAPAPHS
jgi:hypothetical protein